MPLTPHEFKRLLLRRLAERTLDKLSATGDNATLSRSWRIFPRGVDEISVGNDYYWSRFYFLGRGEVRPRQAKLLVWFKDPANDPRLRPLPKRRHQVKRLTKVQFARAAALDQLVVRKRSGPYAGRQDFKDAIRELKTFHLPVIVKQNFKNYLRSLVPGRASGGNIATARLS